MRVDDDYHYLLDGGAYGQEKVSQDLAKHEIGSTLNTAELTISQSSSRYLRRILIERILASMQGVLNAALSLDARLETRYLLGWEVSARAAPPKGWSIRHMLKTPTRDRGQAALIVLRGAS
jgi:hypothetical protein